MTTLRDILACVLLLIALIAVFDPHSVGQWRAKADIGYETIWMEYLADQELIP